MDGIRTNAEKGPAMTTPTNSALHMMEGQGGWQWVPKEPTPEIIAAAALAVWPVASAKDIEMARKAAPLVLMAMNLGEGFTVESLAASLATMAPAYRAMLAAAPQPAASPSVDRCQYAEDVGMTEYRCVGKCQYSATPKTALDHFADEVEASGEAEKHAASVIGYVAPFEWKKHQSEVMCKVTRTPQSEYGIRAPVAAVPHFAIPPSNDVSTLQQELALAYEGFARERGITKELAAAMNGVGEMLSEAHEHWDADRSMKVGKILIALLDYKIRYDKRSDAWHAALSKVQQS